MRNRPTKLISIFHLLTTALLLTGCAGWSRVREPEPVEHPDTFLQTDSAGSVLEGEWWVALGDSTLDSLIRAAFTDNPGLAQGAARYDQFLAANRASRASLMPTATVSGKYTEQDAFSSNVGPISVASLQPAWDLRLTAAYELDLSGKLRAGRAAAYADLLASRNDLRALLLSLSAQVGRAYYSILEQRQQKELLERTVASYEDYLELVRERYSRGVVTSVDVYQAESTLANAWAQLALAGANLAKAEHALSILLGRYPETGLLPDELTLPEQLETLPAGLPSELLQRRPDVAAAEARLVAADRRAAEAVASRYPSFSLTGAIGSQGIDLDAVLDPDNLLWQAIANVSAPLFQGGRLKANAERAEAAWNEANAGYRSTLLNAFREVEDALAAGQAQLEYLRQTEREVAASDARLRLTTEQYLQGITSYLQVVTAQTAAFSAQRSLISAKRQLIDTRIQLVTALGGGWMDNVLGTVAYGTAR